MAICAGSIYTNTSVDRAGGTGEKNRFEHELGFMDKWPSGFSHLLAWATQSMGSIPCLFSGDGKSVHVNLQEMLVDCSREAY